MASLAAVVASFTCICLIGAPVFVGGGDSRSSAAPTPVPKVTYVPASTRFACHLVGFRNSPTHDDYGVEGNWPGDSFSFDGKIWWLFGDTRGTAYFHGYPNKTPRYPENKTLYDNDSIATSDPIAPGTCPQLDFITAGSPVPGAFSSPSVSPDPLTGAAQLSLRTNETPIAGIAVGHSLFAAFTTDNPYDAGLPPNCEQPGASCLGRSTRSVMAELVNDTTALQFKGLFDISAPSARYSDGAKFVELSMAASPDGKWVYLFGVPGGRSYDLGSPYLARLPESVAGFTEPISSS